MDACGINVIRECCAMGDGIHISNRGVGMDGLYDICITIMFLCPFIFFMFRCTI